MSTLVGAGALPANTGGDVVRQLSRVTSGGRSEKHKSSESIEDDERGASSATSATAHQLKSAGASHAHGPLVELKQRHEPNASMIRPLGVSWNDLSVRGSNTGIVYNETVLSQFMPKRKPKGSPKAGGQQTILDRVHGSVKPGEMLLVLGRPDSGCTTLLSMISNRRNGYGEIEGDIRFGSLTPKEAEQQKALIMMNTEEEIFFPTLTVGQTMDFATKMMVPNQLIEGSSTPEEVAAARKKFLLESVGIAHTEGTKVGNEYVRGVSGGERKRVSIIETMAGRGSIYCWDNSTRGLDASTALDWARLIRDMTDELQLSTIATLYQAGNGIYEQFDKVLVLDQGQELYFGPREHAVPFMESLGFYCDPAANKADFLTSVCVPTERKIIPGFEDKFPRNALAIREAYEHSEHYASEETKDSIDSDGESITKRTIDIRNNERHKSLPKNSPLTSAWLWQVKTCLIRQYQIIWGDKATLIIKQVAALVQALVAGSLFYNAPDNSAGLFVKGGAVFFSILYNSLTAMSEVTDSFSGRPVMAKHKSFAFYHPSAFCIAQIAADIPIILFQVTHFGIVLYFMAGLKLDAGAFFTFWIQLFATTMCLTALFRTVGAAFSTFDAASKVSGFVVSALVTYTGYMIQKPNMHPWFVWIYWINPLAYSFSALLTNEFHDKVLPCVGNNIVPVGPAYIDSAFASCAGVPGAVQGASSLTGDEYVNALSYSHGDLWRNFGITWAWWAFFVGLTVFFTCRWQQMGDGGRKLLVPREYAHDVEKQLEVTKASVDDPEANAGSEKIVKSAGPASSSDDIDSQLNRNTSIFTWKDLTYTVKTPSGDRVLLDNVKGYVKPGMLGALMGSSGAGKTTLLDVLAQRKTEGTIHGSILVDGRPLSVSFQRSAGYCEQLDVHEPFATVREALEFSALLRQSREVPREEKLRYVDTIIDLLELHDLENTLIGTVGNGLNVEQRKRVTIGVELVSKPSILIFLDEPTSGLDGQASYNTVRFLRKLADVGQAVLATIHQPSAQLFAQFDSLLLLAKGGKTVYFGDIGDNADTLKDYFGRNGAPCPEGVNPAEHMIEVVSGAASKQKDWNQVWLNSPEHTQLSKDLDKMIAEAAAKPAGYKEDGFEFATNLWTQTRLVSQRMNVALFRNTDYINNKFALHIGSALFTGFSFWMIGDSVGELQLTLFAIFSFIFVAPGVIAQLQPLFIQRRDIYEAREKKSKMYHWAPFVTGLVISELPYLVICAVLYYVCWYYTCGFPSASKYAGSVLFVMIIYEFIYTGIGQFIAAYAPNAVFASLVNPLALGILISFCGVLVPYAQLQAFWRYWIYYLNPFTYLMGAMLTFVLWDQEVTCKPSELAVFDTPSGETCQTYLSDYLTTNPAANLLNPAATSACEVCQYTRGSDYMNTINVFHYYYGWRDAAICVIFALSSYSLVFVLMKLRTKATKTAE